MNYYLEIVIKLLPVIYNPNESIITNAKNVRMMADELVKNLPPNTYETKEISDLESELVKLVKKHNPPTKEWRHSAW
jgi:hypothetical protein